MWTQAPIVLLLSKCPAKFRSSQFPLSLCFPLPIYNRTIGLLLILMTFTSSLEGDFGFDPNLHNSQCLCIQFECRWQIFDSSILTLIHPTKLPNILCFSLFCYFSSSVFFLLPEQWLSEVYSFDRKLISFKSDRKQSTISLPFYCPMLFATSIFLVPPSFCPITLHVAYMNKYL